MQEERRKFDPPEALSRKAQIRSIEDYHRMYRKSLEDPAGFWGEYARELDWYKTWDRVCEGDFGKEARWRDRAVSGSFRLRLPYYFPESGGADLRVSLRSGGPVSLESVALVPPTEPEKVIRLP